MNRVMKQKRNLPPSPSTALRRAAEKQLKTPHPVTDLARTHADTQMLLHELQVHQVELEM